MSVIVKVAKTGTFVSIGGQFQNLIHGANLKAGETITIGEACYIKNSDGKVYRSIASLDGAEANVVRFFALDDFELNQDFAGIEGPVNIGYSDGTAPKGKNVYLDSTTAGRLNDTPAYPGQPALGHVLADGKTIRIYPANGQGSASSVPAQVAGFAAANGTGQSVLTWTEQADALGYRVEKSTAASGQPWTFVKNAPIGATTTVTGLSAGTVYFRVSAIGLSGVGVPSAVDPATIS